MLIRNFFPKPRLLLHVCCAGCGAYVSQLLSQNYITTLYFYNPNIFPKEEYDDRLSEAEGIASRFNLDLIVGDYDHSAWLNKVKGYEDEPEKGKRCLICCLDRLKSTIRQAKKRRSDFFTTTLNISPHKDAKAISKIGDDLAGKYGIKFLDKDFKKQDGFKKSVELSKKIGLYRQNYCGCEFSKDP